MNKLKRFMPVLIFFLILFTLNCCGGAKSSKIKVSSEEISVAASLCDEQLLISTAQKNEMVKITSSGMLQMYLDEKTMSVCIYDTANKKFYKSLPEESRNEAASTINIGVILGGKEYTLTSQSDSLAFSCTKYKKTKSGIVITYNFRQSLENGKKLNISLPVSYTLSDGMLSVKVECDKISCDGDGIIHSIELLPYFGTDVDAAKGDYIVLPDGCGAIMDLEEQSSENISVRIPVYGSDSATDDTSSSSALIAAFGRKCGDNGYVCLVSDGEAMCEINSEKACLTSGYNRAWSSFIITPVKFFEKNIYVSDNSYKGEISLSYRFLSNDNANYIGMASAVRELLIRESKLRENGLDENLDYPFNLTLVLSQTDKGESGDNSENYLTNFNESYELLTSLKAKGLTNVNVRLKGLYSSGTKINEALGTKEELDLLLSTQDEGGVRLYGDYSLYSGGYSAVTIDSKKTGLTSIKKINSSLNSFITQLRQENIKGVSISDVGESLNCDFSDKEFSIRQNVKDSLYNMLSSVFASKKLMIGSGNLYSIKYASQIIDLPCVSSLSDKPYFSDVPFIQGILHGIVDYSHQAANLTSNTKEQMLKAAEYGALPHYQWHCSSDADEENENTYYMLTLGEAKAYYDKMKNDFSPLRTRRITSHEKIKDNVYLTRFGEDAGVYVNYSDKAVSVAGITIDAMSYALIS